jgi:hypothetical protein
MLDEASDQLHVPAALPPVPILLWAVWAPEQMEMEKYFDGTENDHSFIQTTAPSLYPLVIQPNKCSILQDRIVILDSGRTPSLAGQISRPNNSCSFLKLIAVSALPLAEAPEVCAETDRASDM